MAERLLAGVRSLVKVTPATGSAGGAAIEDAAQTPRTRVAALLDKGEWAGALDAWAELDEPAKQATRASAEALRARLAAGQALAGIRTKMLATAGTSAQEQTR
jgi:hypothetical protein